MRPSASGCRRSCPRAMRVDSSSVARALGSSPSPPQIPARWGYNGAKWDAARSPAWRRRRRRPTHPFALFRFNCTIGFCGSQELRRRAYRFGEVGKDGDDSVMHRRRAPEAVAVPHWSHQFGGRRPPCGRRVVVKAVSMAFRSAVADCLPLRGGRPLDVPGDVARLAAFDELA